MGVDTIIVSIPTGWSTVLITSTVQTILKHLHQQRAAAFYPRYDLQLRGNPELGQLIADEALKLGVRAKRTTFPA